MIFRQEVLDYKNRDNSIGEVLIRTNSTILVLSTISIVFVILIFLSLFKFEYTKRISVTGKTVPENGLSNVVSLRTGVVTQKNIGEGISVKKDDVLFVISTDVITKFGGATKSSVGSLGERRESLLHEISICNSLAEKSIEKYKNRLSDLSLQKSKIVSQIDLQSKRVQLSRTTYSKFKQLEKSGFLPALQTQQKNEELLDQISKLIELEKNSTEIESQIKSVDAELKEQPLRDMVQVSTLKRSLFEVEQAISEAETRHEVVILAPTSGKITSIQAEQGQTISEAQPLATIVPNNSLFMVQLAAPSSAIGFIHPGQRVQLRYQAFPYAKFGVHYGTIREVSRSAIKSIDGEPMFRFLVMPDKQTVFAYGKNEPLQPDMAVDADVMLDRRTLIEWIFEPFFALKGRI